MVLEDIEKLKKYISNTINRLGLLEGLSEVEREKNLEVGENLFIEPSFDNLEPLKVVSKVEHNFHNESYTVFTKVLTLQEVFSDLEVCGLEDLLQILKNFFGEIERGMDDPEFPFLQFLSETLFYSCYEIWKQSHASLFSIFEYELPELPCFPPHFRNFLYGLEMTFPEYFKQCKDIIIGVWLRKQLKGQDRAYWKWSIERLLQRISRTYNCREFTVHFSYGNFHKPIYKDTQFQIATNKLGESCLGQKITHTVGEIIIHFTTPSLEIYLALHPGGQVHDFISLVIDMWMSCSLHPLSTSYYKITWNLNYTGEKVPGQVIIKEPEQEGLFRLGHSLWLGG